MSSDGCLVLNIIDPTLYKIENSMYRIIQNRKIYFIFSGLLMVLSILAISIWGLNFGIDFTGGSLSEIELANVTAVTIERKLTSAGFSVASVQPTSDSQFLIRVEPLSESRHQRLLEVLREDLTPQSLSTFQELRFESIGPTIGRELQKKAIIALLVALGAIIFYIAWAFRKVSRPVASWKFGIGAIFALTHDVVIITGIFAVLGHFMDVEINTLFVTALLTIIGFSVHDTIVVYDRTRENLIHSSAGEDFENIVNKSVNETLTRSINTSLTTLFVLAALYFFGGATIEHFVLALMLGIVVGTYSSIFIASPLLLVWQRWSNS